MRSSAPISPEALRPKTEQALIAPAERHGPRDALISRRMDFWLMGGVSCVTWLVFILMHSLRGSPTGGSHYARLLTVANVASLFIFYPHFILTYKMAWGRGPVFRRKFWPQFFGVPMLAVLIFALAYGFFPRPHGLSMFSSTLSTGGLLASGAVSLMLLSIGWHQSKQTFGCMMVYSRYDDYAISRGQKELLRWTAYALWTLNIITLHCGTDRQGQFMGLPIFRFGWPPLVHQLAGAAFWLFLSFVVYRVFYRNWRDSGRWPSANFVIPLAATTLWWAPPFYSEDFYLLFSTTFHALQYWPFALRYESRRWESRVDHGPGRRQFAELVIFAFVLGLIAFWGFPWLAEWLHATEPAQPRFGTVLFFFVAAHVTLNLHHYFIDNALWRFDQPEIQAYLLPRAKT